MEELGKHTDHDENKPVNIDPVIDSVTPPPSNDQPVINLYGKSDVEDVNETKEVNTNQPSSIIPLYKNGKAPEQSEAPKSNVTEKKEEKFFFNNSAESLTEDRLIEEPGEYLKYTPARVAVGRAGSRPKTSTLLKFRFDH